MNIVEMLRDAQEDINKFNYDQNETIFKNLLSHGYTKISAIYKKMDADYGDTLFTVVQDILIWLMFSDGQLIQGEYDAYLLFCDYADYKPLSVEKCVERSKKLTVDYLISLIKHIAAARKHIPEDDYEAFVKSLCHMVLFGDQEIDHEEYELLACFLTSDDDYCPSWDEFQKEI